MTRLLPWLAGASLVVALLLGVGYCGQRRDNVRWQRDWDASQAELAVVVHERDEVRLANDTILSRADSIDREAQKAPKVVIRTVKGETVFVPDTLKPDSVIVIPAPVAAKIVRDSLTILGQRQVIASLRVGIVRERVLTDSVETTLHAQIALLQNKPRDNGWRVVYGVGYMAGYDTRARAVTGAEEQSRFAHGPSVFVGVAKAVPFPRLFPRRS